jgi:transcriptional regulator with XRE-family HTH domain
MRSTTLPSSSQVGHRELARRLRNLRGSIGRQVAELRSEAGVSRRALAIAAGIDPAHLWRIEAGAASPSLDTLVAISACLGCDASVRLFPGFGPRIHDRFQAPMVEALLRRLHRRWRAMPEVPVPLARGVIDLVIRSRGESLSLACECHSELRRLEQVMRRAAEKTAALAEIEGPDVETHTLLLLRSTRDTRAIARLYESTLAAAYPARTSEAIAALAGEADWPGGAIVWAKVENGRADLLDRPPPGIRLGR